MTSRTMEKICSETVLKNSNMQSDLYLTKDMPDSSQLSLGGLPVFFRFFPLNRFIPSRTENRFLLF